jgi:LacI family transcriptional regulator
VLSRGHRHLGVILGPTLTSTSRERNTGYEQAFARPGVTVPEAMRRHGPYTYEAGHAQAVELLSMSDRPTALPCGNDVLAIGAYEAARRLRLDVPGDVSIIGFDDIPMAGWESFRLTTVHQDIPGIARAAARRLITLIRDGVGPAGAPAVPGPARRAGHRGRPDRGERTGGIRVRDGTTAGGPIT